jgi:hypothetical protein
VVVGRLYHMTTSNSSQNNHAKEPKDLRLRNQHFPGAEKLIFDEGKKGFVPLPVLMRNAIKYLSAVELRVLVYLQTRCGQYMICYPTISEIAHDLDMAGPRNLTPHLKGLEKKKFISTITAAGKRFFLVHDPAIAIAYLLDEGIVKDDELFEINELLEAFNRDPIVRKSPGKITPINQAKQA